MALRSAAAATGLLRLRRVGAIARRAGAGRSQEQLAAVGVRDVAAVGPEQRVISRLIAVDDDQRAVLQRVARDATPEERIRRPAFDHPLLFRAVRFRHFQVNPGVRIHPLELRDRALQQHGSVRIEFAAKRVVRDHDDRRGGEQAKTGADERYRQLRAHQNPLNLYPEPQIPNPKSRTLTSSSWRRRPLSAERREGCYPARNSPRGMRTRTKAL